MSYPKPRAEQFEGSTLVEIIDCGGNVLHRCYTDEDVAAIGKPRTHCGTAHGNCCHPLGLSPGDDGVVNVIGKIVGGKINGKPLRKWIQNLEA